MLSVCGSARLGRVRLSGVFVKAALAVAWLVLLNPGSAVAQAMHDVADPQGRFTISVPTNWTVGTVPYRGDTMISALGPADADGTRSALTVYVLTQPQPTSAEAVAKSAEPTLRRLPDYTSVEEGPTTVGGLQAYYRYFTRTREGHSFYQVQVYIARGPQMYVITCTILNDRTRVERDLPVMRKIISTFQVTAPHAATQPTKSATSPL